MYLTLTFFTFLINFVLKLHFYFVSNLFLKYTQIKTVKQRGDYLWNLSIP